MNGSFGRILTQVGALARSTLGEIPKLPTRYDNSLEKLSVLAEPRAQAAPLAWTRHAD